MNLQLAGTRAVVADGAEASARQSPSLAREGWTPRSERHEWERFRRLPQSWPLKNGESTGSMRSCSTPWTPLRSRVGRLAPSCCTGVGQHSSIGGQGSAGLILRGYDDVPPRGVEVISGAGRFSHIV